MGSIVHNEMMKYGSLFGWGVVIYGMMALAWSGLTIYGYAETIVGGACQLIVLIAVAAVAGRSLRLRDWRDVLPYSFAWALIAALLDAFYSVPFVGWTLYADWHQWVMYGLITIIPLLAIKLRQHPEGPRLS